MKSTQLFSHPYLLFLGLCVPVGLMTVWTGNQPFDIQFGDVYLLTSLYEFSRWLIVGLAAISGCYSLSCRYRWGVSLPLSSFHFYFTALGVFGIFFCFIFGLDHFHRPGLFHLPLTSLHEYGYGLGQQPIFLDGFDWSGQTYFNRLIKVFGFILLMGQVCFALNVTHAFLKITDR